MKALFGVMCVSSSCPQPVGWNLELGCSSSLSRSQFNLCEFLLSLRNEAAETQSVEMSAMEQPSLHSSDLYPLSQLHHHSHVDQLSGGAHVRDGGIPEDKLDGNTDHS